jgi:hypothetical protein
MGLGTIALIVLILLLIGVFPAWPHSSGWDTTISATSATAGKLVADRLVS